MLFEKKGSVSQTNVPFIFISTRKSYLHLPIPFEELEKILNLMINKLLKAETSLSSAIFKKKEGHKGLEENRPSDPVEIAILIYGSCIQYVFGQCFAYLL